MQRTLTYFETADLLFDWFGIDQTCKLYLNPQIKTTESYQVKQEISCTVILPLTK